VRHPQQGGEEASALHARTVERIVREINTVRGRNTVDRRRRAAVE
jgi:hypothetical protein